MAIPAGAPNPLLTYLSEKHPITKVFKGTEIIEKIAEVFEETTNVTLTTILEIEAVINQVDQEKFNEDLKKLAPKLRRLVSSVFADGIEAYHRQLNVACL